MLQLSPGAAALLAEAQQTQGVPESYVRVYGEPAPEAGTSLQIAFVDAPEEGDQVATQQGIQLSVSEDVAEPLAEAFLDVEEAEQGTRLVLKGA